jgi:hypothetical protein
MARKTIFLILKRDLLFIKIRLMTIVYHRHFYIVKVVSCYFL